MKRNSKKNLNLQKKLAVAMSLVNALNTAAPVALPYVNVVQAAEIDVPAGDGAPRTVTDKTLNGGTTMNVNAGGTAIRTTINSGGKQIVSENGITSNTQINGGGIQIVSSSGAARDTHIYAGGMQIVDENGNAGRVDGSTTAELRYTFVHSGGIQKVLTGGNAYNTMVDSGGKQIVESDGTMGGNTVVSAGGVVSGGSLRGQQYVFGTASGVSVMPTAMQAVQGGGRAYNTTVAGAAVDTGILVRQAGSQELRGTKDKPGIAYNTRVLAAGNQYVGTQKDGELTYGIAYNTTVSGGTVIADDDPDKYIVEPGVQEVNPGSIASQTVILNSGQQKLGGGTAFGTVISSGGVQSLEHLIIGGTSYGGVASGTIISSGGEQSIDWGTAIDTVIMSGGIQTVLIKADANIISTRVKDGGSQKIFGGMAENTIIESGGQQIVEGVYDETDGKTYYAQAKNTILESGGTQNVSIYGIATSTTINNGAVQNVASGGTANASILKAGGQLLIASGAVLADTVVSDGASLPLNEGIKIIVNSGRTTEHIILNGGELVVNDYGTAQIDEAISGTMKLLDVGYAEARLGDINTAADTTFNITNAFARGDTVRLGQGTAVGKTLVLTNMDGYANFYVNTDLENNKSDLIQMNNVVNGTKANTIRINYDPTLAQKTEIYDVNTTVATVQTGTATFEGAESTVGGMGYIPVVTSVDNGKTWQITSVYYSKPTEQMYAALGQGSLRMAAWRQGGQTVTNRMAQLRQSKVKDSNIWVDFTRGKNTVDNQGHNAWGTYNQLDIGYDHCVGGGWTLGGAYGLRYGSEGYICGSGSSHDDILSAYGLWQGNAGRYAEVILRAGRMRADADWQDPNQLAYSSGSNSTYGQAVSLVYGQKMEKGASWYLEPHVGLQWSHVNGYNYNLSDGTAVSVDGATSIIGNVGVNVGQTLDNGGIFYARADLMHDFSGGVTATMTKRRSVSIDNDFKDTWLDLALGFRRQDGPVEWHIEAGRLGIGSKAAQGNWVWNVGLNYKF
ncbi:adhesin aidA-I [Anaerovibrio sp. JC8]|uniref:autotransporter outer membrane beta-barrel domain-containing protein n=1 Tax=Anaerovibrio sp. JC8 TaxID=1240085 RepID=UPI000A0B6802|nr:autotransporter outer membrane beta-barrel domain-containing protein [Anaerovibrio sp. JC8]ORU00295.1 adhesin aidA-I [Anaerovibrio sp. JC8]